tara:strand:- start:110 stop:310 length:201 start_codon:yes stop_codon:yes gene_type:complete
MQRVDDELMRVRCQAMRFKMRMVARQVFMVVNQDDLIVRWPTPYRNEQSRYRKNTQSSKGDSQAKL